VPSWLRARTALVGKSRERQMVQLLNKRFTHNRFRGTGRSPPGRRIEQLGERHEGGVVLSQVVPQFPATQQQAPVGDPPQRWREEVRHGHFGTWYRKLADRDLSPEDGKNLEVDQFRRGEQVCTQAGSGRVAVRAVVRESGC